MFAITFSLAAWLQFQLELVGTPKYDAKGGLVSSGSDLGQAGLTEYMFDVLYLTWGIQLLVACTTTYAWWLYLIVSISLTCAETDAVDTWVCGGEDLGIV